ncbi:MAG: T9SS type A sorting domain-containing protein, partial [Bacteroidetes bacterium]|nr:T9SS type A sorting domain-containing protein [Bacteroidota bacterium]
DNVQNLHVNLAAGIYLISVENDQEKITKKVSLK